MAMGVANFVKLFKKRRNFMKFRRFYSVGDPVDLPQIGKFRNEEFPEVRLSACRRHRADAESEIADKL